MRRRTKTLIKNIRNLVKLKQQQKPESCQIFVFLTAIKNNKNQNNLLLLI